MGAIGFTADGQLKINGVPRSFSSHNAYNLISGSLALMNSVVTAGMATTLYTGNGTTQSVVTGVDMATQWGNSASETFGGLVWGKSRSNALDNFLVDTVRGTTKGIITNSTSIETTSSTVLTSFNSDGFSLGSNAVLNTNLATYASLVFQTTHRTSGTTNHGKAYTCHYNPFTGFTIVKYEGSGLAGHEIPHHLGRKLGFVTTKNLSAVNAWLAYHGDDSKITYLNETTAGGAVAGMLFTDTATTLATYNNTSANQFILYGWANSFYDADNTLQGNYEIGVYNGTGAAGNKVTTRGKPAWVMIKRVDSTGNWAILDNLRNANPDKPLFANLSNAEGAWVGSDDLVINTDGFTWNGTTTDANASGGQYLYMVVYDNDSGSGKSKYPRATDTSALNLNAVIPFANGLDNNGIKNTVLTKNETVSGLTLTQGKNYVYAKNDGTYGVDTGEEASPKYGNDYLGFGTYFDVNTNMWFTPHRVFVDKCNGTSLWTQSSGSSISSTNGTIAITNTGAASGWYGANIGGMVVGKKYRVVAKLTSADAGSAYLTLFSTSTLVIANTIGVLDIVATTTGSTLTIAVNSSVSGSKATWDNIAIYPINNDGSVDTSSATPIAESRNYLDAIVYADAGGQPTYIEQLPKVEYKDVVKANEYQGKNACTAWAVVDFSTTPPTIKDSFNISTIIKTGAATFDTYFKLMENTNYSYVGLVGDNSTVFLNGLEGGVSLNKCSFIARSHDGTLPTLSATNVSVLFFGGKN